MRKVTVTLATQEYVIVERPTRKNEAWRKRLEKEIAPIVEVIKDVNREEISMENAHNLAPAAQQVLEVAMKSPAKIRDLVIAYSPELEKQKEALLDEAYDSEFMDAFIQILGLAYPFGGILPVIQRLSQNGDLTEEETGQEMPQT